MGASFLDLPGVSGDFASAPDIAAYTPVGGGFTVDVRVRLKLTLWSPSADDLSVVGHWTSGTDRSWLAQILTDGTLRLIVFDGANKSYISTVGNGIADGAASWVRWTLSGTPNDGIFYTSNSVSEDPTVPSWTKLGDTKNLNVGTLTNCTVPLEIGSSTGGTLGLGDGAHIYQVWAEIDGTVELDVDFSVEDAGTTSFTEDSGNAATMTVNGSAEIKTGRILGGGVRMPIMAPASNRDRKDV